MIKLFKSTDEKLAELGWKKEKSTVEDSRSVYYWRTNKEKGYQQYVDIIDKTHTAPIMISSAQPVQNGFASCQGLTYRELRLFLRKMKEIGLTKNYGREK